MSEAPAHLTDAEAQAWQELADRWPARVPMPTGARLEAFLGQTVRLRQAQAAIARDGLIVADAKGNPCPHPAILIERQAQEQIRAWGDEFDPDKAKRRAGR